MRARLLLLAAALAAFGASLGSGFHFDDYAIFADRFLTSSTGWLDVWSLRQTRPLTYLSFWLNYQLGGADPVGYHALNLALHVGAVLLAYECLRRLIGERPALVAAALFAVHPFQAEAVDYVWGRSIVLATLLCLASLWCWLAGRHWEAVVWFLGAVLAKEEVVAFPLALLLLHRKLDRKHLGAIAAMFGVALAAGVRVIYATAVTPGAPAGFQAGISPARYLLAEGPVILRYLRLLVVPYGFTVDADARVPALAWGLTAWALVIALAAAAWRFRGKDGWGVWAVAGLILLLPSSSIFPAADLSADRRMYLPLVAFAAAAALLLARVKVPARAAGPAAAVLLAAIAMVRTQVWMNEQSLWSEAVRLAPEKLRPKIQLARALPPAQALDLLAKARALAPNDPEVATETGRALMAGGQPAQALVEFGRALGLDPRDARNFNNRGVALAGIGQMVAARADFERALALDPTLGEARENLKRLAAK
ncbi:MAG: tetratricopeptide repeat protein [Bryobacteraceae bacterium]